MKRLFFITLFHLSLVCASAQTGLFFASDRLSSTNITCICQDQVGYIWIGTEYGLNRFDGYRFIPYLSNRDDSTSLVYNVVSSLYCDRDGNLWVGTSKGLQRYDYATDRFLNYHFPDSLKPRVATICQLHNGTMLVGTSGYGIFEVDPTQPQLSVRRDYQLDGGDTFFNKIYEDYSGTLWKGGNNRFGFVRQGKSPELFNAIYGPASDFFDFKGITVAVCRDALVVIDDGEQKVSSIDIAESGGKGGFRYAMKDRQGNVYVGTRGNGLFWIPAGTHRLERHPLSVMSFDINSSRISALAEDRQGNVWIGIQQKGLLMLPNRKAQFASWSFAAQKQDIGTYVSSVCEGDDGVIWCTVQNHGVYGFNPEGRIFAHPQAPIGVENIYRDSRKNYWLSTAYGLFSYNPLTGAATKVISFDCDRLTCMTDDGQGHLFISAFGKGLLVYDQQAARLEQLTMIQPIDSARGKLCNDWILSLQTDHEGCVWIGTADGVACYDHSRHSFLRFGWQSALSKLCNALCETRDGDMLIGTDQGLFVWRRQANQFELFPRSDDLKNLVISYIIQDNKGDIWCSTSAGIWHYLSAEQQWVSYLHGAGLAVLEYINCAGLHTSADRIFFATNDGLTTFTPQQVASVQVMPGELNLTGFYIGGNAVSTLTESYGQRVTTKPITESNHFTISYLDNSFSLEFSLLNYSNAANTIFEYRLDDAREWQRNSEGQNVVSFNHLPTGTYKLEVRAIDNGVVSVPAVYTITVTPPWYRTPLAYVLYLLFLLAAVGFLVFVYRRHVRRQLDEDRMKFLINATHDIRSPLTLIMSPLQKLRRRNLDDESRTDLEVIDRNAQRILTLVNQILDVRKIDKQQMHLHCRETDMQEFIGVIYKVYEYNAQERGITFTFNHPDEPVRAWIDRTQFDKVISNLLSNAFKFTFDQGNISIDLSVDDDARHVVITVTDNGTGMREDTIQHIFDRFYQGKTDKSSHIEGTGIGMNLCKMIVDMHHGTITARNRQDGVKGSQFTVTIPMGHDHLTDAEIDDQPEQPATVKLPSKKQPRSNYRVLIVDDDEEIGRYVGQELSAYYHFAVCHNGKDGLKELLTNPYDVVISDVMMPEMDGFTMLRMLKSNVNISHIPVILLTSKTDVGNRLEGLEKGADAYLTKPFSMDELHLTIDNLIANHLRLKGKFSGAQQPTDRIEAPEIKGNDEQLMERIMKSINAHLSDSDFSVDTLCDEVGISRAHLHRKMKDMTGIPVSEFIRNLRLEQGARMLREQKLNITQVAYAVGFSNLGYFSTVFRKHFGVSPREFVEKN